MEIIKQLLSYNEKLERRSTQSIQMIVLHCTELPTLSLAREFGERVLEKDGTGHSGHYYIDRDGQVYSYVEDDRIAHHVAGHNADSIGIELVNTGRYPNWFVFDHQSFKEPYTDTQIVALRKLMDHLRQSYPNISRIARHADLDERWIAAEDDPNKQVRRRLDPGPLFPWEEIQTWWNSLERNRTS